MITEAGSRHIKRYLMHAVPNIAQSIGFGVGSASESTGDISLDFEVMRAEVALVSYDFVNDRLIFKATLPDSFSGTLYEAGLWSQSVARPVGEFESRSIVSFDSSTENWTNATWTTSGSRIGLDSLEHTPAASATVTSALTELNLDFSGDSGVDHFTFAYNVSNANTAGVTFLFLTDNANYYSFVLGAQSAGYKVEKRQKATATITGAPNWSNISEIRVTTTATAGGAASVAYDGIRVEDRDSSNTDNILVAREVYGAPYTKLAGIATDIEFSLAVNIT